MTQASEQRLRDYFNQGWSMVKDTVIYPDRFVAFINSNNVLEFGKVVAVIQQYNNPLIRVLIQRATDNTYVSPTHDRVGVIEEIR